MGKDTPSVTFHKVFRSNLYSCGICQKELKSSAMGDHALNHTAALQEALAKAKALNIEWTFTP